MEELGCIDIVHSIISDDVIEKLTGIGMLHYQVKLTFCLNYLVELYHSRMTYFLENFDLTSNAINVGLILNLILLQYLDCHFLLRNSVNAQLDFPKSSFSQRLINQKVRYLSQLPLPLLPRGSCAP